MVETEYYKDKEFWQQWDAATPEERQQAEDRFTYNRDHNFRSRKLKQQKENN